FNLVPNGGATNLNWSMHGPNTFLTKVMTVFTSMDKMVGKDFEQGLVNLKAAAEGRSAAPM
ncbi:MAG: SRPBCC family protein, partial [Gemmatimonadaceae bacterium]